MTFLIIINILLHDVINDSLNICTDWAPVFFLKTTDTFNADAFLPGNIIPMKHSDIRFPGGSLDLNCLPPRACAYEFDPCITHNLYTSDMFSYTSSRHMHFKLRIKGQAYIFMKQLG